MQLNADFFVVSIITVLVVLPFWTVVLLIEDALSEVLWLDSSSLVRDDW